MQNGEQIIYHDKMITCGQRGFTVTDVHGHELKAAHNFYPYLDDAKKAIDTNFVELPCISLNGTSATSLLKANQEAREAVQAAVDKLVQCHPHPRDYQSTPSHYRLAEEQHDQRMQNLHNILVELDAIALHVVDFVK